MLVAWSNYLPMEKISTNFKKTHLKAFFKVLFTFFLILSAFPAVASHFMGVDITYECIGPCTYRIYHSTYYDCSGNATPTPVPGPPPGAPNNNFSITGIPNTPTQLCNAPVAVGGWTFVSYTEVTPICPSASTECTTGAGTNVLPGVSEAVYYRDYDFCAANCSGYQLEWESCCRNYGISSGASGDGIYSGSTVINPTLSTCNSSPQFANPPVPYICAGQAFTFNQGAFDPDGDSLAYSIGPCLQDPPAVQVGYNNLAGYTPTQPLGSSWDVAVDPFTGDISITPQPGNLVIGVMCLVVDEFRNGVQIGQVTRDIQITVIDCSIFGQTNIAPTISGITNLSAGATATGLNVTTCACEQVCFDLPVVDPDLNQVITMFWSANLPGATFANANNPNVPVDTIISTVPPTGQFCWVPTEPGIYSFLVTVQDDGCPILGQNQNTVVINVTNCSLDPFIGTTVSNCYDVDFSTVACGGSPPFTYQWSGSAGLTFNPDANLDTLVHTFPGPGTYTYSVTITDSLGINSSSSGSITLFNTAVADAGTDTILCPNEVGILGTPAQAGYSYQWSANPPIGTIGGLTGAELQVSLNNQTSNSIPVVFTVAATDINGCTNFDSATVVFSPEPSAAFSVTQAVCVGENSDIIATGVQAPNATYTWDFGGGVPIGSGQGFGPHQISWPTPGTKTVTLQVEVNGCISVVNTQLILVNDIPTSSFTATGPVCTGEASIVNYVGTGSPTASYIYDLDGGIGTAGPGSFPVVWSTPGLKNISLIVVENGCISPATNVQVQVYEIPENTFSIPASVCEGDTAQVVYSGSASTTAAYIWNFNGAIVASGSGPGPYKLIWPTGGVRTVCLQVQENGCLSAQACQTIDVFTQPNAGIASMADQCIGGNTFTFTSTGDANVDTYAWNFGSGANPGVSTSATPPAVSYIDTGVKTVSLVVTRDGCVSDSAKISFEVIAEPEANFNTSTGSICSDSCINFTYTGTPVGPGESYAWDFGPNAVPQTSTLPNPGCVSFPGGGLETITLTVSYRGCVDVSIQQIDVNAVPQVSAGPDLSFCEGDGGVQLDGSVLAGSANQLYYEWWCDDPGNCGINDAFIEDPTVLPNVSGSLPQSVTYYFQVYDQFGCRSRVDSVEVEVKAKPKMDAGPDVFICAEGPGAFLTGDAAANNEAPLPLSYQWIPTDGLSDANVANPFARPDTTTIYTLIGNSINGCSSEPNTLDTLSTVTVHVLDLPIANAGSDTAMCLGDTIRLQGFGNSANGQYTYAWTPTPNYIDDPSSATPRVSPPATTTFFLVVTAQGCDSYADSVTVVVDTKPTLSPGDDKTICLGDSVVLDGRAAGDPNGAQYSYNWTPAAGLDDPTKGQPLASPESTTLYEVFATSEHGCGSDVAQVLVTVESTPIVEALSIDTVICEGSEIELKATHSFTTTAPANPVTYRWLPQSAVNGSNNLPNVFVSPKSTTIYTVEASIAGDCPTTDQVVVTVAPKVEAGITADTSRICKGEATQLYGTGGLGNATFEWSPAAGLDNAKAQNPVATPDTTTTYTLVVREGVCEDTAMYTVIVNTTPEAAYFASQSSGCEGLEVSFLENSPGAVAFRWDFGDGSEINNEANPTYVYNEAGTYPVTLTVVGEGGCESSITSTTVTTTDGAFADFGSDPGPGVAQPLPAAVVRFTSLAAGAVNWFWDFGDGKTSADADPIHTYNDPGSYEVTLTVTDENGCVSSVAYGMFDVIEPGLLIPNIVTPNGDGINDSFEVMYNGKDDFYLKIFDRWGKEHFISQNPTDGWNGGEAKEGVYFYQLEIGEKAYTGNITLMR